MRSPAPIETLTSSSTTRLPKDTLTLVAVSLDMEFSQIAARCPQAAELPR
jgi:hypothetical protein